MTPLKPFRNVAAVAAMVASAVAAALAQPADPLAPPANGPRKADPTWNALVNATVHVKPGQTLEHATIVTRDGRIVSVQGTPMKEGATLPKPTDPNAKPPADDMSKAPQPPAGARVWDCTGLHVYAGFIDPYIEVDSPRPAADSPGLHWNPRVTPQRTTLEGRTLDSGTAESLRKMGFTAAALAPRGGIFRGSSAVVSLAKAEDDRQLSRPPVYAANVYQAVEFDTGRRGGGGGGGNTNSNWPGYPDSQMGAIAVIRQTFSDADWQAAGRASKAFTGETNALDFLAPSGAGASAGTPRAGMYLFNTDDELESFRAIKIATEFHRPIAVLGCGNEFRRIDGIVDIAKNAEAGIKPLAKAPIPFIIPLNYPEPPKVGTISQADSVSLRDLMTWEQAPTNPRRLEQAGMHVSLTTSKLKDRGRFRDNLRKAVSYGLTQDQALAMITTRPAELLGVADRMGTVEQGKLANLVVLDGPYFTKKSQFRDVWVDGKRYEINAGPGPKLTGEWEVSMDPSPKLPEGATRIRITFSIDKDNNLTIRKRVTNADGTEKFTKASAKNMRVEGQGTNGRISFVMDHEPLGDSGVFAESGVFDGPTMSGEGVRSNGARFRWTAKKIADEPEPEPDTAPKSFTGTWVITEDNGQAMDAAVVERGEAPTITIDKDNVLTVAVRGQTFKADSVKIENKTMTVAMKGDDLGFAGQITSVATLEGDTFKGTTTLADGTKRTFTFKRQPAKASDKPADKKPDDKNAKPTDPITGIWAGTATSPAMPQPLTVSLNLKLADATVTGSITSQMGTVEVAEGSFKKATADTGTLTFKITPPGSPPISFSMNVTANSMTGSGSMAQAQFQLTATRSGGGQAASSEEDEPAPTDIPDKITYPFGPYAIDAIPPQETVLFTNATIWTVSGKGVIQHGWMLISGGKITGIGEMSALPAVDAGAKTIDLQGKHITPGLIDCHSHTGISGGVNESGQAVTAEVRIQDVTDPDAMSWYWQLAGGLTAVNNLHGSANPIGGQNCVNKIRWGAVKPDDLHLEGAIPGIKFALGENVKQVNWSGADSRYPVSRMGVETIFRDRFTAAKEYLEAKKRGENVRRDLELETLGEILEGKRLIHCHSYRQDEILALCRVADDFHFKLGTFQHILEGYKVADEVRDHSIGGSCFSDWWAYKVEVQDAIPYDGAIMHDVGAIVSFNSDSDELARRMNVEAGKAVKYGDLAPEEAIKFVTINPAKQLKIDDKVGSLEVGKDADFAIWVVPAVPAGQAPSHHTVDGTPMSAMSHCDQTWVDGRCYFSTEQDAKLRQSNAQTRVRIIQKILAQSIGAKKGDAKPGDRPPDGPPGGTGERRRRRPTDDLTAGVESNEEPTDRPPSLLQAMIERSAERRREMYLQLWRMGVDPTWARCGDCGESNAGMGGAR